MLVVAVPGLHAMEDSHSANGSRNGTVQVRPVCNCGCLVRACGSLSSSLLRPNLARGRELQNDIAEAL